MAAGILMRRPFLTYLNGLLASPAAIVEHIPNRVYLFCTLAVRPHRVS